MLNYNNYHHCTLQEGCWCLFDEAQSINSEAMAVLLDHVDAVLNAVKSKHTYATLGDGQEVCMQIFKYYNKKEIDLRVIFINLENSFCLFLLDYQVAKLVCFYFTGFKRTNEGIFQIQNLEKSIA